MTKQEESNIDPIQFEKLDKIVHFLVECYCSNWDIENHEISDILALDFDAVRKHK